MMMFAAVPVMATKGTAVSGRWVGIASPMSYSNHRTAGGNVFLDIYNEGTDVAW